MKMEIELNGRKLIKTDVEDFKPGEATTVHTYDDGTVLRLEMDGGEINVKSNKKLELLPDGKTIRILD